MFKKIAVGVVAAVLVVAGIIINTKKQKEQPTIIDKQEEVVINNLDITVQIIGEVQKPGIYEMNADSRVYDLIILAGGFTQEADTNINLVQKLKDGMIITINRLATTNSSKISINTANASELDDLPSIGPSLANDIVAYRNDNGPFTCLNDLCQVQGFTNKILVAILPYIVL